jgi:hypothetical protein
MTLVWRSLTLIALRAVAGCEGTGGDKTGGSPAARNRLRDRLRYRRDGEGWIIKGLAP